MPHLPPTQSNFQRHPNKPSNTDPSTVTDRHRPQAELPLLSLNSIADLRKRVHVHCAAQQPLPEHNCKHDPHTGYKIEQAL